eukprot:6199013-Pleurochrysis_carterae.AAC.1
MVGAQRSERVMCAAASRPGTSSAPQAKDALTAAPGACLTWRAPPIRSRARRTRVWSDSACIALALDFSRQARICCPGDSLTASQSRSPDTRAPVIASSAVALSALPIDVRAIWSTARANASVFDTLMRLACSFHLGASMQGSRVCASKPKSCASRVVAARC